MKQMNLPVGDPVIGGIDKPSFWRSLASAWREYLKLTRTDLHSDMSHRDHA